MSFEIKSNIGTSSEIDLEVTIISEKLLKDKVKAKYNSGDIIITIDKSDEFPDGFEARIPVSGVFDISRCVISTNLYTCKIYVPGRESLNDFDIKITDLSPEVTTVITSNAPLKM